MNKVFRVIWNEFTQTWIAVSENAKAGGKRCSAISLLSVLGLSLSANFATAEVLPGTLPTGQNVTQGSADFNRQGENLTVRQHSQKLITQWNDFSIGQNASVNFIQPNSTSAALNRVITQRPSEILGRLTANGHVLIVNANGVVFGKNSRIDVASLTASTLQLSDADFSADNYHFKGGENGEITADGVIQVKEGGRVVFVAPLIENNGTISAPDGQVLMASGTDVELDVSGDGLVSFRINKGALNAIVDNGGGIDVGSGAVLLTAKGFSDASQAVVNNSGVIEANSMSKQGGRIILGAGTGGQVSHSGTLDVSSAVGKGGLVMLEADAIALKAGSDINATGMTGGGDVLVGGDWQGGNNLQRRVLNDTDQLQQAIKISMESGAGIDASATNVGDGGTVVLWSDIQRADSLTTVEGRILAEGGASGGNGGQIETSGRVINVEQATVSTKAAQGKTGDWLLDPGNITISNNNSGVTPTNGTEVAGDTTISSSTLTTALANNNVILATGAGAYDITVADAINYTGASSSLTLNAGQNINLAANITSTNALNLQFNAPVKLKQNVALTSNGGDVNFASTLDGFSNLTVDAGNGNISLSSNVGSFIPLEELTLTSAGGSILLSKNDNPIGISSYGKQAYNGDVVLQGATTINSLGQTAQTLASSGTIDFTGTAARLQITLVGAQGGSGGADAHTSGGGSGSAGQVTAQVRVEDETLIVTRGVAGSRGQNESENGNGSGTELGGSGGSSVVGYAGGAGGNAGVQGRSGAGGGGGSATVARFSSGGDLVAGGAGGGGGGGDNGSGGSGTTTASYTAGIAGQNGGQNSVDSGGGGGGGGGLQGGNGGTAGNDDQPGSGGYVGRSGATDDLLKVETISTGYSTSFTSTSVTRLAVDSGVSFTGSVTGEHNLAVNVGNGGTIDVSANIDTGIGSQTYSAPIALGGNSSFKGTNISTGLIDLGAYDLTIDESGTTNFNDVISGSGSLTKKGVGELVLHAANTYSGGTTIENGITKLMTDSVGAISSGSLGTGSVIVQSGGSIDLNGKTAANELSLAGSGFNDGGALFNSSTTPARWQDGLITLTDDAIIKADNAAMSIGSSVTGPHELSLSHSSQTITLEETVDVAAFSSDGTLIVSKNITTSGVGGQIYNGDTQFANGLTLAATNGNIGGAGKITAASPTFVANNGNVNFTNPGNDFQGTVNATGKDVTLFDGVGGITLGGINASGDIDVTSHDGAIAQAVGSIIEVAGSTDMLAQSIDGLTNYDITLDGANNDFQGPVDLIGKDVTVSDINDLSATVIAEGDFSAVAGGDLDVTLDKVTGNSSLSTLTGGDISTGGTTGGLVVNSGGDIVFRPTQVNGNAQVDAVGNIVETELFALNVLGESAVNANGFSRVGLKGGGGPSPRSEIIGSTDVLRIPKVSVAVAVTETLFESSSDVLMLRADRDVILMDVRSLGLSLSQSAEEIIVRQNSGGAILPDGLSESVSIDLTGIGKKTVSMQEAPGGMIVNPIYTEAVSITDNKPSFFLQGTTVVSFATTDTRIIRFAVSSDNGIVFIKPINGFSNEILEKNTDVVTTLVLVDLIRNGLASFYGKGEVILES